MFYKNNGEKFADISALLTLSMYLLFINVNKCIWTTSGVNFVKIHHL